MPRDPNCDNPNYAQQMRDEVAQQQRTQKQRDIAEAVSMLVVAIPVFLYHWKLARKEK